MTVRSKLPSPLVFDLIDFLLLFPRDLRRTIDLLEEDTVKAHACRDGSANMNNIANDAKGTDVL